MRFRFVGARREILRARLTRYIPPDIRIHDHAALFVAPMAVPSPTRKVTPVEIVSNIVAASRVFCRDSLCLVLHPSSLSAACSKLP